MKKLQFSCIAMCLVVALAGCGGSKETQTANSDKGPGTDKNDSSPKTVTPDFGDAISPVQQQQEKPKISLPATTSPSDVVKRFLTALKNAKKDEIGALLTDTAWVKIGENQLIVGNSGIPSAEFTIGKSKFNIAGNKDVCHVDSELLEKLDNGETEKYLATWVLRQQSDGWRIAGMASPLETGGKPVFLNFEKPELIVKIINGEADLSNGVPQTAAGGKNATKR